MSISIGVCQKCLTALVALVAASSTVAACGGSSGSPSASAAGSSREFTYELKFTRCLQSQGINVADPSPSGGVPVVAHDAQERAASAACEKKLGEPPSHSGGGAVSATALREASCLRAHGLDVRDPTPQEAIAIPPGSGEAVVNACLAHKGR